MGPLSAKSKCGEMSNLDKVQGDKERDKETSNETRQRRNKENETKNKEKQKREQRKLNEKLPTQTKAKTKKRIHRVTKQWALFSPCHKESQTYTPTGLATGTIHLCPFVRVR
jgi:hypothetical protein